MTTAHRLPSWLRWGIYWGNSQRCHYGGGWLKPHTSVEPGHYWVIDHITPLAHGGTDDDDNLTLSCRRHNRLKGLQSYADFKAALADDADLRDCGSD